MHRLAALALVSLVLVAACTSTATPLRGTATPTPPTSAPPAPTATRSATPVTSPVTSPDPGATATPGETAPPTPQLTAAWAQVELTDARTGQPFRIADHAGKVIFIETMAVWCVNCRAQQRDAREALAQLPGDVVFLSLDVDPRETADQLRAYADENGFGWIFASAGPEMSRALEADFGTLVLNPPATPIVVIGRDGRVTLTDYGPKSVDRLVALAREHGV